MTKLFFIATVLLSVWAGYGMALQHTLKSLPSLTRCEGCAGRHVDWRGPLPKLVLDCPERVRIVEVGKQSR